jgi:hypothetical protein
MTVFANTVPCERAEEKRFENENGESSSGGGDGGAGDSGGRDDEEVGEEPGARTTKGAGFSGGVMRS